MTGHHFKVTAHSVYKANEMPLSFTIDDKRLEVWDIICRWAESAMDQAPANRDSDLGNSETTFFKSLLG